MTAPLFLNKHSSGCCNFQLISGVLEKINSDHFCHCPHCFLWRRGFSGVFTLPSLLMSINTAYTLKWAASVSLRPGVYGVGSIFFLNFCVPRQRCHHLYGSICPCEACEEELMLLVGYWLQKITINWVSQWPVTNNSLIEGILATKMHPSLDTHSCGHQTGKCRLHLRNLAWDIWLLPCLFLLILFLKTIWNITLLYVF